LELFCLYDLLSPPLKGGASSKKPGKFENVQLENKFIGVGINYIKTLANLQICSFSSISLCIHTAAILQRIFVSPERIDDILYYFILALFTIQVFFFFFIREKSGFN
jgi:hypothetical protein